MATSEEKIKVLKMIQEGKLTPEEGVALLDSLDEGAVPEPARAEAWTGGQKAAGSQTSGGRWFRVRVTDNTTGKVRANVRIPLGVARAGMKMGMRFAPEIQPEDMEKFMEFVNIGEIGHLVDVYDDNDGEHVEVSIE
jgi:hypothetical protein